VIDYTLRFLLFLFAISIFFFAPWPLNVGLICLIFYCSKPVPHDSKEGREQSGLLDQPLAPRPVTVARPSLQTDTPISCAGMAINALMDGTVPAHSAVRLLRNEQLDLQRECPYESSMNRKHPAYENLMRQIAFGSENISNRPPLPERKRTGARPVVETSKRIRKVLETALQESAEEDRR